MLSRGFRFPTHHARVEAMSDYEVDWNERKYALAHRKSNLPEPKEKEITKYEELLPVKVIDFDAAARGYIGGRHHNNKGLHKIFALGNYPTTVQVCKVKFG